MVTDITTVFLSTVVILFVTMVTDITIVFLSTVVILFKIVTDISEVTSAKVLTKVTGDYWLLLT
jgi:hypothetical protein